MIPFISNNKNTSTKLQHWDARQKYNPQTYLESTPEMFQELLEYHEKVLTYKKCFITEQFVTDVLLYVETPKLFLKCTFEINNITNYYMLIKDNRFINCTFYLNRTKANLNLLYINSRIYDRVFEASNKLIENSFIHSLCKKYKNNLAKANPSEFYGIHIDNYDFSDTILPQNKDFFLRLGKNSINGVTFPKLDFTKYDLYNNKFLNVTFNPDCTLHKNMYMGNLNNCILPIIDFRTLPEKNYHLLNFQGCTFHNNTVFPSQKDFFTKATVSECLLPNLDYSEYLINKNSFNNCKFSSEATLPKDIFKPENIHILTSLSSIPHKHIFQYLMYSNIIPTDEELNTYKHILSPTQMAIIYKKFF